MYIRVRRYCIILWRSTIFDNFVSLYYDIFTIVIIMRIFEFLIYTLCNDCTLHHEFFKSVNIFKR